MTKGRIEQFKAIWELCFIGWLIGFVALLAQGRVGPIEAVVFLIVEVILLVSGPMIADLDRRYR